MASINVSNADKEEFDELKPEDMTQKDFFSELLAAYRRDNGEIVDVDDMVEEINQRVASECELAAYRGVSEAIEQLPQEKYTDTEQH